MKRGGRRCVSYVMEVFCERSPVTRVVKWTVGVNSEFVGYYSKTMTEGTGRPSGSRLPVDPWGREPYQFPRVDLSLLGEERDPEDDGTRG